MKIKILCALLMLISTSTVLAQTGEITGNIKDATTDEGLFGVTVILKGTTQGASTDFEGNFKILNVKSGTYTLDIQYISYKSKSIAGVTVLGDQKTIINTTLEQDNQLITEVQITATRKTGTEMSVINEIRKADQVAVGVSATQIAKTQDRDASAVMKRVPGVSIVDDRFVVIRGLSERYNTVLLNDVITPSLEVDKKSFSFDLIPSSMIDRMLVFKSGAADMPGEFAGGLVRIYTKSIPDEDFISVSLGLGYRSGTTFKDFNKNSSGGATALGFGASQRELPSFFTDVRPSLSNVEEQKAFKNDWDYSTNTAIPDIRANVSLGKKFKVGKIDASNLTSLNYSNSKLFTTPERNRYLQAGEPSQRFFDENYSNEVKLGLLSNFNFILSPKTRLDFRNLLSQIGNSETVLRSGNKFNDGTEQRNFAFRYEQRTIFSTQLGAVHNVSDRNEIKWTAGYGVTKRNEPDFKRVRTTRADTDPNAAFQVVIPPGASTFDAARFYSNLDENVYTANADFKRKLGEIVDGNQNQSYLKAGFYAERKTRESNARWLSYTRAPGSNVDSLLTRPVSEVFDPMYIGRNGFVLSEGTNPSDQYSASNTLGAAYVSYSRGFGEKFFAVLGFRGEYNRQQLVSGTFGGGSITVDNPIFSPLPSLNLSYNLNDKNLIRAAYSFTVNRPEFRELAPFSYYDFNFDVNIRGNENLKIAEIQNLDLRYEFYPSPGEIITLGAFYKDFTNPIEQVIQQGSSGVTYRSDNAEGATNYGLELEVRKSLQNSTSNFLKNITLIGNASVIESQINFSAEDAESQLAKRPMAGQSAYLLNGGVYYNNLDKRFQVNLLYNVVGKRIFAVGDYNNDTQISNNPTQYEMPRNVLDLNFTKRLSENLELKGGINDILNQAYRIIQDTDSNGKIDSNDNDVLRFRKGSYSTLALTFKF